MYQKVISFCGILVCFALLCFAIARRVSIAELRMLCIARRLSIVELPMVCYCQTCVNSYTESLLLPDVCP